MMVRSFSKVAARADCSRRRRSQGGEGAGCGLRPQPAPSPPERLACEPFVWKDNVWEALAGGYRWSPRTLLLRV